MDNDLELGERLTELMILHDIKNKTLADEIGVHVTTVQRWKRNAKALYLSQLLKLADYFKCSLDYLVGRSDNLIDYVPKTCPPFYPRFRDIVNECGKTRYQMHKETRIKDSYFSVWSKGTDPHIVSLIEAADYLGVTLDYLVGRDR